MIKKARKIKDQQNYEPEIIYMTCNKKVNSKYCLKYNGQYQNPNAGSVVFEELSVNNTIDFHLTAQKVTEGSSTPTQYRIVYYRKNKSDKADEIPEEAIAQFTYEQCYNYYNWSGAVRVPACLQCADKLSKLAGEHILQDVTSYFMTSQKK